ncbi:hypothetical protein H5410_032994 [Solanum commersonii]|uniref:Transposase MuDR plant domain-containing protein n=1 Tax=Solanum commersonii TaxID=4109 RepID=A0A9J5YPH7_SOLCO|nr:hypothetical protein H5410_032994 [Solanum commersonii]
MKILGCIDEVSGCVTLEKLKKLKVLAGKVRGFLECVVENPNPTYQREVDVFGVGIEKDYFSVVEFLSYTKDIGYTNVKGFYYEDNNELVQVTSDPQLLEFVKDLVDSDEFHVYVIYEVDELEELPAPTGLLLWSDPVDEFVGINTEGTMENDSDLNEVDTELHGVTQEVELDMPSSDTDVDDIPDEDDSNVDEVLRSLRAERRNKRNLNLRKKRDRKKKIITEEVPIDEAGVDRGFEHIGINKKDRYIGRLGGDEKYIDSSECDSDDSTDMLDTKAVGGVDLPGRRKSKRVKYDDECTVAIFELGMIFENAKKFRKALAKYAIGNNSQIKLRPNEAHRGEGKRKQIWRCSKATFEVKYNEELYKMSRLGNESNDDLLHYPQVSWVRAFFQEHSKCDAVENNMCETFNSWILSYRHKSIITMLEEIRRKLMTRTVDMVKFADTWMCDIAPIARLMLKENKEKSRTCKVGVHTSQPIRSYQPEATRFNQPTSTTSNNHAFSTTVCGDTSIVKRARETIKSSQPPPFVDTSIPVTRGINSQLPPRTRQTTGQKRERVATGEDFTRGGSKRSTNDGSSNVGFGTTQVQPGTSSQRILPTGSSYKDASLTGIDLGFKPRGLRC